MNRLVSIVSAATFVLAVSAHSQTEPVVATPTPGAAPGTDTAITRTAINLPRGELGKFPYSDAVLAGNTLYISGRGGVDPVTMKVPDDPAAEAKLMLDSYKKILEKAGMTMDNLVTVTVYCPDLSLYATFNEVYRTYFGRELPARAFVGSGPLLFGMRFEMQGIAVK